MKLLALDGNSIANRAFYGIKVLSTKDGQYTNAILGFMNILNSLLEREHPDGVAVAFDLHAPTFRHKMYDLYKAGRKPMPLELVEQMPVLKELLTAFGYHCVECAGYEADDILGTFALAAEQNGNHCVISTGDRDSLQLVSPHTKVLLATTKMGHPEILEYTPESLFEKYGLTPAEMIELKALMGDASDHIPGVAGVGEKTATDLIQRYHSVEYIYAHLDELDIKEGVRAKLSADRDNAYLSKTLGTICRTVPVSLSFEEYGFAPRDNQKLAELLRRLEFFKMLKSLELAIPAEDAARPQEKPAQAWTLLEPDALAAKAKQAACMAVAVEKDCSGIGLAFDGVMGTLHFFENRSDIIDIFSNKSLKIIACDSKRLYSCMDGVCELPLVQFDITLAAYLAAPSDRSYDIDRLAGAYLRQRPALTEEQTATAAGTAAIAMLLYPVLEQELEQNGLSRLLKEIELPLARVLSEMERCGFLVDTAGIREMGKTLSVRIQRLENEIHTLAGEPFNIKSPAQLGVVLFEKLGLKAGKKTKTGYSTTAEVLEKLSGEHPIIPLVLEYRSLIKLQSTYCEGLLKAVQPDGRVHSTFNQTETRTGRISSLEPNLQNIPVRSEEGRELRKFFVARAGYVLLDADYSQIELRVLAHIAGDTAMIEAFQNGADIHTKTASEVFHMPLAMVTPKMRSSAKAVNFGIVYGIGAFSLAKDIGVTRAEAAEYIEGYFATYPQVQSYMQTVVETAREKGYAETMFGRRRYLPELKNSNGMLRAFGERVARNMPIQGTAADIIKLAMVRTRDSLCEAGLDARVILQVHDELIVEAAEQDAGKAAEILHREMEQAVTLSVPLPADVHAGKTWYEAKE